MATSVITNWKEIARFARDMQKAEMRPADARRWKLDHKKVLEQRQRDAEALNKWINLLGIPASARCGVVVYDGYIFKYTTYYGRSALQIGKPSMAAFKADPENYGKIFWSHSATSLADVATELENLEAEYQRLTDYLAKKATAAQKPAPQPSLEETNPRAMLTDTERDVIDYLERMITHMERQYVLSDRENLVFALTAFVEGIEFDQSIRD